MRKLITAFSVSAIALTSSYVYAGSGSDTANVTASLVAAPTVTKSADLAFGSFSVAAGTTAGTLTIAHDTGGATAANGVTAVAGSSTSAANFNISNGVASSTVTVGFPKKVTISIGGSQNANEQLDVLLANGDAAAENAGGSHSYNGTLSGSGALAVPVGGQITGITDSKVAGNYTGTFDLTVVY